MRCGILHASEEKIGGYPIPLGGPNTAFDRIDPPLQNLETGEEFAGARRQFAFGIDHGDLMTLPR
jgi:hypothetical protein